MYTITRVKNTILSVLDCSVTTAEGRDRIFEYTQYTPFRRIRRWREKKKTPNNIIVGQCGLPNTAYNT